MLGFDEGNGVGRSDGARVGIVVGRGDGKGVGLKDGSGVGSFFGNTVGESVGCSEGARLRHSSSLCITGEILLSLSDVNVTFNNLPSTSFAVIEFDTNTNLHA